MYPILSTRSKQEYGEYNWYKHHKRVPQVSEGDKDVGCRIQDAGCARYDDEQFCLVQRLAG